MAFRLDRLDIINAEVPRLKNVEHPLYDYCPVQPQVQNGPHIADGNFERRYRYCDLLCHSLSDCTFIIGTFDADGEVKGVRDFQWE